MEVDSILHNLIDLHIHLGSSSSPHFLWELAHEQGIRLPEKNYWKFINSVTITRKTSQENYHQRFDLTQLIQSSPYGVEHSVHNAISAAYREAGVSLIEIRLNPMRRNKGGEHDLDKIILSATIGMKKACLEYPVRAGIILEMDRRFNKEKNIIIAQKAAAFKNDGVVGIDVSGPDNKDFKIDNLIDAFDLARDAGLGLTIHTGEFTPVAEIWEVMKKLRPHRLGHGIRCVDDPALMSYLVETKTVLEICPTSNTRIGIVKDWNEMASIVNTLKNNQIFFTINSDSPEFLETNAKKEFQILYRKGILTLDEIKNCISLANKSSFV
ncbi:adenosine deaminase [Candidatus Roizmanbacteria bacterium]|nr:adenosine deaminase [Candidatus Roizmanbacteria bacterium]